MTSFTVICRTGASSRRDTNEQTWQDGSVQTGAFLLAKSDGRLADPARCRTVRQYRLMVVKNVVTRGLAENSPRPSFSKACTHGLLSVSTETGDVAWVMYGEKCLTAAAIPSASISHGSQRS